MSRLLTPEQTERLKAALAALNAIGGELAKDGVLVTIDRSYNLDDPEAYAAHFRARVSRNESFDVEGLSS